MAPRGPARRYKRLGPAGEGVGHWWAQRLTALALVPLTVWFVASVAAMAGADYPAMLEWMGTPAVAGLLVLFIVAVSYHAALGMQVVIVDYVHHTGTKIAGILCTNALAWVFGLIGVLSVLSVLFKG